MVLIVLHVILCANNVEHQVQIVMIAMQITIDLTHSPIVIVLMDFMNLQVNVNHAISLVLHAVKIQDV